MNATRYGIWRQLDHLGRVVLPKEMRTVLGLAPGSPVWVTLEGSRVVIEPHGQACVFCGQPADTQQLGRWVCDPCGARLASGQGA